MSKADVIERMDALALSSLNPELFEMWAEIVRHYDTHFPQFKGVLKRHHADHQKGESL